MMPRFFDTHSHVPFKDFDVDRADVVARMRDRGIWTLSVGTDLTTSRAAVAFVEGEDGFFASIGLHPNHAAPSYMSQQYFDAPAFEALITHPKVVAVGECGLDYYRMHGDITAGKRAQFEAFEAQMELAIAHDKPLMIHCRPTKGFMDAYDDLLDLLAERKKTAGNTLRGNIHFFVGTPAVAARFYELGFMTSFTGVITFTHDYDETVRSAPLDMILTETDCPYAAPAPHRGERNEPAHVELVVKRIAALRQEPIETVAEAVLANARRLFKFA